jgi:hypothetical protein
LTQVLIGTSLSPFEQKIYDARTGELVGVRALRPVLDTSRPSVTTECLGATPELRRTRGNASPWDGCATAHRCIVCAMSGAQTSDPPCTPEDYARLAALADAGS